MYLIFYILSLAQLPQVEAILAALRDLALPILVVLSACGNGIQLSRTKHKIPKALSVSAST
jgi:hypothetical protein